MILFLGWSIYFFLHSFLAASKVKTFFQRLSSRTFRLYRISYVMIATGGLLVMLFVNAAVGEAYLFSNKGPVRYGSLVLATFGVVILRVAFRQYNLKEFLGFKPEQNKFKADGILQYIRHPIYAATILITIAFFLFSPTWATAESAACILIYLFIGMWLEERKLIATFGSKYLEYRGQVPAIFPKLNKVKG